MRPGTNNEDIISVMTQFLDSISVSEELIIMDPYLFSGPVDPDYEQLITGILAPYGNVLETIKIITNPKCGRDGKTMVLRAISSVNPNINVMCSTSGQYHDRFWISANRHHGIVVGTSLNGLGKKYTLIGRLEDNDVNDLVESLVNARLI